MSRLALRAGLAALALASAVNAAPAAAEDLEYTAVGFATPVAAYINALYRPPVAQGIGPIVRGLIDAECEVTVAATGSVSGSGGQEDAAVGVFVAKVVTTYAKQTSFPPDGLPAATGIICSVYDGDVLRDSRDVLRSGNSAYNAFMLPMEGIKQPRICVRAYVIFGDTSRIDGPETCK